MIPLCIIVVHTNEFQVGGGSEEIIGDLSFREEVKLSKKRGAKI